jgi:DNA-binding NtrC family response regulator
MLSHTADYVFFTYPLHQETSEDHTGFQPVVSGGGEIMNSECPLILIVEDEVPICHLLQTILKRLGYSTLGAQNSAQAMEICQQQPGSIDLLLTDFNLMPGINGTQLAQQLGIRYPRLRTLLMSGVPERILIEEGHFTSGLTFLEKPFTVPEFLAKFDELLTPNPLEKHQPSSIS